VISRLVAKVVAACYSKDSRVFRRSERRGSKMFQAATLIVWSEAWYAAGKFSPVGAIVTPLAKAEKNCRRQRR
jgi:hypothetical protein